MSKYVLMDTYTSGKLEGKPRYFKQMTGIGPMATPFLSEAQQFDSEEEARTSEAHRHWASNWTVQEADKVLTS